MSQVSESYSISRIKTDKTSKSIEPLSQYEAFDAPRKEKGMEAWVKPCIYVLLKFALFLAIFLTYFTLVLLSYSRNGNYLWEFLGIFGFALIFITFGFLLIYIGWNIYLRKNPEKSDEIDQKLFGIVDPDSDIISVNQTDSNMDSNKLATRRFRHRKRQECCPDPCPSPFVWFLLITTVFWQLWALMPEILAGYSNSIYNHEFVSIFGHNYTEKIPIHGETTPFDFLHFMNRNVPYFDNQEEIVHYGADPNDDIHSYKIFFPKNSCDQCPLLIIIHTGDSYITENFDSESQRQLSFYFTYLNYMVISIEYRSIAEGHPQRTNFYGLCSDIFQALLSIRSRQGILNYDLNQVFILGRGRGGHVATVLSYAYTNTEYHAWFTNNVNPPPIPFNIRGVISVYGLVNPYGDTDKEMLEHNTALFNGIKKDNNPILWFNLSSPHFVSPQSPPTLIIQGVIDRWINTTTSSDVLVDSLHSNNVQVTYVKYPLGQHGFDHFGWTAGGQLARYYIYIWTQLKIHFF